MQISCIGAGLVGRC